jgi:hypothetical protein
MEIYSSTFIIRRMSSLRAMPSESRGLRRQVKVESQADSSIGRLNNRLKLDSEQNETSTVKLGYVIRRGCRGDMVVKVRRRMKRVDCCLFRFLQEKFIIWIGSEGCSAGKFL